MKSLPLLAALVLLAPGCVIQVHSAEDETTVLDAFTSVSLDVEAGGVSFHPSSDGSTTVYREAEWTGDVPQMQLYVEEGVLYVISECPPSEWVCSTTHEITLPPEVNIEGVIGSGGLFAEELLGSVQVDVGSGGAVLQGIGGDVALFIGSGGLAGERISGAVDVQVGSGGVSLVEVSGDITADVSSGGLAADALSSLNLTASIGSGGASLGWDVAPDSVTVDCGSGGLSVDVPAGEYAVTTEAGSGGVVIDGITQNPEAPRVINLFTGSGGITLHGY